MKWASIFICAVFFVAGMLSILASLFNWHWFFESSNARMLTGKMSRRAARLLYAALGIAILYMGSVVARSLF
ncbi:MAG: immunity 17 family protein [Candidatus Limisoma sp.]